MKWDWGVEDRESMGTPPVGHKIKTEGDVDLGFRKEIGEWVERNLGDHLMTAAMLWSLRPCFSNFRSQCQEEAQGQPSCS